MNRIDRTHRRVSAGLAATAVTAAGLLALVAAPARAASHTISVSNRADDGSASTLRAAIDQANTAPGENWMIILQGGDPYVIDRDCTDGDLDDNHGGDLDLVTSARVTIVASNDGGLATIEVRCEGERAIDATGMGTLRLQRIRVTGGNPAGGQNGDQAGDRDGHDAEPGGAVRSDGTVELYTTHFADNRTGRGGAGVPVILGVGAGGHGAAGGSGAAVRADEIVARSSVFTGNSTGAGGPGGPGIGAGNDGGSGGSGGNGTLAAFDVDVSNSVFQGNVLGAGGVGGHSVADVGGNGGSGGSGGAVFTTALEMYGTTVADNRAGDGGAGGAGATVGGNGGPGGRGGGVWAEVGSIDMSTIADNAAGAGAPGGAGPVAGPAGGAGFGGGIRTVPGPGVALQFVTVTGNSAADRANLAVPAANPVFASIIGDPQGGGANCDVAITSLGRNVFGGDESCGGAPTDTTLAGPLPLGPLADNGGTTVPPFVADGPGEPMPTRMPLPGGALDGLVPLEECTYFGVDQRNEVKPVGGCEPGAVEAPIAGSSAYVPLPPQRVFDTRQPGPVEGFVPAGGTITVPFAGVAGVPADATAVAFNLTITQAGGAGYVTAFPSGTAQPLASNLNTVRSGQDVPNFVMVPLGADGAVSFFSDSGGHLLADVAGYFVPTQAARAGRIVPMEPSRVFDTRQPGPLQGKVGAGQTLTVDFDDLPAEAAAVVLNVTGTQADAAGYITVYPGDVAQPHTSALNLAGAGHTAANMTIVPLGADGTIKLFSDAGAHLLADITGYVTGPDAPMSSAGLTVPMDPVRVFDTRSGPAIPAGGSIDVPTAGTVGIPTEAAAVLLNVTVANAAGAGYVTGWPSGTDQPLASMLNVTEVDETRANASIMPVGETGGISYFTDAGTHLLADAFGYLLPAPQMLVAV
jgi:hypothetical protein